MRSNGVAGFRAALLRRERSTYPLASAAAFAALASLDVASGAGSSSPAFWISFLALCVALGTLHGLLWAAVQRRLARVSGGVAFATWTLASFAAGAWLAHDLGGFSHLGGRYDGLAKLVLALCFEGAASLSLLCCCFQPTPRGSRLYLLARSRGARAVAASVLFMGALLLFYADRRFYPSSYANAHVALRVVSTWLLMFACVAILHDVVWFRPPRWVTLVCSLGFVLPMLWLNRLDQAVLGAFSSSPWATTAITLARNLSDLDRDGYSSWFGGGDCAPFDPRVSPGAREIPDNGVDDNCAFGDARRSFDAEETPLAPAGASPLDVVVITIDALRPDHLGVYDARYGAAARNTSPSIDRFAQGSSVFVDAYTPGGWTSVAIPALLRGLYPRHLTWIRYYETNFDAIVRRPFVDALRPGESAERAFPLAYSDPHRTLAERLRDRGMATAAVVDDGYSELLRHGLGVERGFDTFRMTDELGEGRRNDAGTVDLALETLRRFPDTRRFFMWVHLFGTHGPDEVHPGTRTYGRTPQDRYDHEIAFADQELGRLLDVLEQRQAPLAIFITSDHGETFDRDGRYHGQSLDQDIIRIPLIARVPGWRSGKVSGLVSLLDLVPTILTLTQTPARARFDGEDLGPLLTTAATTRRVLLSDTWRYRADGGLAFEYVAAYDGDHKVVLDRRFHFMSAYDTRAPGAPEIPVLGPAIDELSQAVYRYLDETGSQLSLGD